MPQKILMLSWRKRHWRVSSNKFMFSVAFGKTIKFAYFYQNIESAWIFPLTTRKLKLLIQSYNKTGEEIKGYLELVIALHNEQNWQRFFYFFLLLSYPGIKTWCKQLLKYKLMHVDFPCLRLSSFAIESINSKIFPHLELCLFTSKAPSWTHLPSVLAQPFVGCL